MTLTSLTMILLATPVDPKVLSKETYAVARWVMRLVDHIVVGLGLRDDPHLVMVLYTLIVFGISILIGLIVQWLVLKLALTIANRHKGSVLDSMHSHNFFCKACRVIPPLFFLIFLGLSYSMWPHLVSWLMRLTWIWITVDITLALISLIDVVWEHIDESRNKKRLPLNGLVQLVKVLLWLISAIVIISILIDKSPAAVFAGLGAFAAVLMLVFKDSILGVVAGVQLAENDSLHVGDWISTPDGKVNGTVMEVTLTTVKILNFDKTVTNLPPYSLVSGTFVNYLNMQESHTRRICRTFLLDADSVAEADENMWEEFKKLPYMNDWITKKLAQRAAGKEKNYDNPDGLVNGCLDTNLGMFRAYLKMWLEDNPAISHEDTCFICTLEQSQGGIPLQVYCFTATSAWLDYESIQSMVFEHLNVVLPKFHLYLFENATGRDEILNGLLESGKEPVGMFGLPQPLIQQKEQLEKNGTSGG